MEDVKQIEVIFNRKDFNDVYLPHLNASERFMVFYGGRGSGKSVFIAQRYLYKCLSAPYFRLLFCRKVARTIRNSQFQLFKDLIFRGGLSGLFTVKETGMEIVCINGNKMIAAGMDDMEKIKSIQEITDVWCEEATEFGKHDMIQLNLCIRTRRANNQMVFSFNPVSRGNWTYESFFVKKEFPATIIKTTYLDNKFRSPDYDKEMDRLKDMDENMYQFSALGEWGVGMDGLIYTHYQLANEMPAGCEIIYGLDFGFNHPTALVRVGLKENDIYVQQIIYQKELTNSDLIDRMRYLTIGRSPVYCDAAEPQRIEELYRAGFNALPANKGKDSIKKGIDTIKSKQLYVISDSGDLLKELQTYVWSKDKNQNRLDMPVKFFDDACDAMRYAVYTHTINRAPKLNIVFT